jgi:outer membrane protein OmpA-like peptidoglycan-associated protein
MNAMTKIIIGALATTAVAWWLNGPMHFGERCASAAPAVAAVDTGAATASAVADCQGKVNAAINGKTINFTTSGSVITADSNPLLDAIATDLKACNGTTVEVSGHTDKRGGDAANQRLSENRANAVVEALVQRGVPVGRLQPKGYGETKPLDAADTQEAYTKNRRIDFSVNATAAAPAAGQ